MFTYSIDRFNDGFRIGRLTMNRQVVIVAMSIWSVMYR